MFLTVKKIMKAADITAETDVMLAIMTLFLIKKMMDWIGINIKKAELITIAVKRSEMTILNLSFILIFCYTGKGSYF